MMAAGAQAWSRSWERWATSIAATAGPCLDPLWDTLGVGRAGGHYAVLFLMNSGSMLLAWITEVECGGPAPCSSRCSIIDSWRRASSNVELMRLQKDLPVADKKTPSSTVELVERRDLGRDIPCEDYVTVMPANRLRPCRCEGINLRAETLCSPTKPGNAV